MGLYMQAYAGAYLVLSNISYETEIPTTSNATFCPNTDNGEHGKQKGKFCSMCGAELITKSVPHVNKQTINRDWFDIDNEFMNVAPYQGVKGNLRLVPQEGRGSWEIDLPRDFTERGGGCVPANKFANPDKMEAAFRHRFADYIDSLVAKGFTVDVAVGLLVWWS